MTQPTGATYDASSIQILKKLQAVRLRPGMYIGDTGKRGLHHLVWEILDNSVDEAMAGHCTAISITLAADGETISVEDNGRGIPVEVHPEEGVSTLEIVLSVLHAGGKFGGSGYEASGGLHGVGAACVNALSDYMGAVVKRDGGEFLAEFCRGDVTRHTERTGDSRKRGTTITFHADPEIFPAGVAFDEDMLVRRFRETAFLNAGLTIKFVSKKSGRKEEFCYAGGISDYVAYLGSARTAHYPSQPFYTDRKVDKTQVQVAFQYAIEDDETIITFANNINTVDGGTHLSGFKTALTRIINQFARSTGALKEKDSNLAGDDIREGITAIVSVRLPQPQFEGQTKAKLGSVEIEGQVNSTLGEALTEYFEKNPAVLKQIVDRAQIAQKARDAAKKQSELIKRKSFLGKSNRLPGKLKDCNSEDRTKTELFIVEGDSAAGCKIGSTKIRLADGRSIPIADIMREQEDGKKHFCYTINQDGSVGIGRIINVRVTKRDAELVRVTLDNGEEIVGTPCHPYMLRDGTYLRADALKTGDSLMPLYTRVSEAQPGRGLSGYEQVWNPNTNRWRFTHILSDDYNLDNGVYERGENEHRHHADFNKLNNNPCNIVRMKADSHLQLHRDHISRTMLRPEIQAKSIATRQTCGFRAQQSQRMKTPEILAALSERNKQQWSDEAYRRHMVDSWKSFCDANPDYVHQNKQRLFDAQQGHWASEKNCQAQAERTTAFFDANPDAREAARSKSDTQWQDTDLRAWRAEATSKQWTPEFRELRAKKMSDAHYAKIASDISAYLHEYGVNQRRSDSPPISSTDGAIYQRYMRFCKKYFGGNTAEAMQAITHHNHKVVSVEHLDYTDDVYDLEVPGTHNFALAAGVFVHNSAEDGRNSEYQAILPIRGKIINAEKHDLASLLNNQEVQSLIAAIGAGVEVGDEGFNLDNLRYDKVILLTDADVDGAHIATLLLTFFYRFMRPLVMAGHVYIAQPPFYKVTEGKKLTYCWTDAERDKALAKSGGKGKLVRFKGLGEMDFDELGDTTLNREKRRIVRVGVPDIGEADQMLSVLMGRNVSVRKEHIISRSQEAAFDTL